MNAYLTASLDVKFVDAPVVKIVTERHDANLVNVMQLAGSIKVEHLRAQRVKRETERVG